MINRKPTGLIRMTGVLREPADYFSGLRRRSEGMPDNILLFMRKHREEVAHKNGGDAFHERWVLLVILSGTGELRLDRRPLRLKPGTVVLLPPLHLHGYVNVSANIRWLFVTFEWPGHTALSENWRGARRLDTKAQQRLSEVVRHYLPSERNGSAAAAHLLELLRRLYPLTEPVPSATHSLLAAVQAEARHAPGEKLPQLAQRLGISESHLRARFRSEAGLSLGRYLREARLREAALWLRTEGLSVKAAAERARYPDIFAFSRAFSRVMGYPPSSVRATKR